MKCKEIEKHLVSYYYGEFEPSKRLEINNHLEACGKCMSSWERLRALLDAIKVKEPEMPESFWQDYRNKVYKKIEGKKSFSPVNLFKPRLVPAVAMVMILLFTVIGGLILYESKQEDAFISKNYELISDLELFEDFEILQYFEEIEASEDKQIVNIEEQEITDILDILEDYDFLISIGLYEDLVEET